jgi:hypothetical protein
MRAVLFVADFDGHAAGDHAEVDDQTACDAIVQGAAVPSIEAIPKAVEAAPENKAMEPVSEAK